MAEGESVEFFLYLAEDKQSIFVQVISAPPSAPFSDLARRPSLKRWPAHYRILSDKTQPATVSAFQAYEARTCRSSLRSCPTGEAHETVVCRTTPRRAESLRGGGRPEQNTTVGDLDRLYLQPRLQSMDEAVGGTGLEAAADPDVLKPVVGKL